MSGFNQLFLGIYNGSYKVSYVADKEAEHAKCIEHPEKSGYFLAPLVYRAEQCNIACTNDIENSDDNAYRHRFQCPVIYFVADIVRNENSRDDREAVQVEAVAVAEANGSYAHIECQPRVDDPRIQTEFSLMYQVISDDIDHSCRNAEKDKEFYIYNFKECHQTYDQHKDDGIH